MAKAQAPSRRRSSPDPLTLEVRHLEDCPANRVESYHDTRPARPAKGQPSQPVTVTRCVDCGEQSVVKGHLRKGDDVTAVAPLEPETRTGAEAQ